MPLYRPSELRHFLSGLGVSPKKVLSQNFLIDGNIVGKILDVGEVSSSDVILEIGPGPGVLTEALLERGATVIAIERDETLAHALRRLHPEKERLLIYPDDALQFPFEETLAPYLAKGNKVKVIANLPYHLTSAIIARLLPMHRFISSVTLMIQKEVAKRFTADCGEAGYGSFSVFIRCYSEPRYAFSVGRHCFFPEPRVDSAVVSFRLHPPPPAIEEEAFFAMTRTAFGQKRKMLKSSLNRLYGAQKVEEALQKAGSSSYARPEELTLAQFITLFLLLRSIQSDTVEI